MSARPNGAAAKPSGPAATLHPHNHPRREPPPTFLHWLLCHPRRSIPLLLALWMLWHAVVVSHAPGQAVTGAASSSQPLTIRPAPPAPPPTAIIAPPEPLEPEQPPTFPEGGPTTGAASACGRLVRQPASE